MPRRSAASSPSRVWRRYDWSGLKPCRQTVLGHCAGRQREDRGRRIVLRRTEAAAIRQEKDCHGDEGSALVAVDEGMIFRNSKRVGCRQL